MAQAYVRKQFVCTTCRNKHLEDEFVGAHTVLGHKVTEITVGGYKTVENRDQPKEEVKSVAVERRQENIWAEEVEAESEDLGEMED